MAKAQVPRTVSLTLILLHLLYHSAIANPPIIHYSHNMRILKIPFLTEPGSIVYRIKASDVDSEEVFFGVLEDEGKEILNFKKINHLEANVILTTALKENTEYNLTIYATDNNESTYIESRLIATSTDNFAELSPFVLEHNPVYVYENSTLNKSITVIRAYERKNSKLPVSFELMEHGDIFDFRYVFGPRGVSTAEIILIDHLDYEIRNLYTLTVLAINGQTQSEVDTRNVHQILLSVVVRDVQDSPPRFHNLPQAIVLLNHYSMNESIFKVNAEDGDTENKRSVTFSIEGPKSSHFKINTNGKIWPVVSFLEMSDIYDTRLPLELNIRASEVVSSELVSLGEATSSVATLIITIAHHNHAPVFAQMSLSSSVKEHSPSETSLSWDTQDVWVIDHDIGLNGTIELNIFDPSDTFSIVPPTIYRNGTFHLLVQQTQSLNYDIQTNLTVIITARDKSQENPMEASVMCFVKINDTNNHYPQFTESFYRGAIFENAKKGTFIANISTTDQDSGDFGQVRYTAIRGQYAESFAIDFISGTVTLASEEHIDREAIEEFVVFIEVRDNLGQGNQNTTELYIRILDVNDNPPVFLKQNYLTILKDDLSDLLHPLQLTAIDIDEINTTNSEVNYEILIGNYEDLFLIDTQTGKLSVNRKNLTHRSVPDPIELTVRAFDLGIPQLSSVTQVVVHVMRSSNYINISFFTRQILNLQNGNRSIEENLNKITGGNVTVHEFRRSDTPSEPLAMITSVRYGNENRVDLDSLESAYAHLIYRPLERIVLANQSQSSTEQEWAPLETRSFKTASFNSLDMLVWIMLALILLVLLLFLYLLCVYCCNRNKNKKQSQREISKEKQSVKIMTTNRNRRRRMAKKNKTNQIAAVSSTSTYSLDQENSNKIASNTNLEKQDQVLPKTENLANADCEFEEQRKYSHLPNVVTYYEFKRLKYPQQDGPKTINILSLDDNDSDLRQLYLKNEETLNQNQKFKPKVKERSVTEKDQKSNVKKADLEANKQDELIENQQSRLNVISGERSEVNLASSSNAQVLTISQSENLKATHSPNPHRKSIFAIAYDRVKNGREVVSSESDKT